MENCIHCDEPTAVPLRALGDRPVCGLCGGLAAAACVELVAMVTAELFRRRPARAETT